MAAEPIRILSDVHYGDRASRVVAVEQLRPLLTGVARVVFNGDTLDTRPGPNPAHTAACRADITALAGSVDAPVTFLTGNHDPDFSSEHSLDLAGGAVFVVHGDVLFEDIVPWGRDAALIRRRIAAVLGDVSPDQLRDLSLERRLAIWRSVAATIPQRHQSERNGLKYALRFTVDTIWPPTRFVRVLNAWRSEPIRASALVRQHRPQAQVVLLGHTHRPRIRRDVEGRVIVNTGAFTAGLGGFAVDLLPDRIRVRRIEHRSGAFHAGQLVAEFPIIPPG